MKSDELKNHLKHFLLKLGGYQRVHIVGCARSGTTMFYYMMMAFENTLLYPKEISVWNWPSLKEAWELVRNKPESEPPNFIVTKRNANWWHREKLERLIYFVQQFGIGIIYMVRDPRDVLTSTHKNKPGEYYVSFDTWKGSIEAGEALKQAVEGKAPFLVVRYEDVIQDIHRVESLLLKTFAFRYKPGVTSLANLEDYVDEAARESSMVRYMHQLRNVDASSLQKWRRDPQKYQYLTTLFGDVQKRSHLEKFMQQYDYPWHSFEKEDFVYEQ